MGSRNQQPLTPQGNIAKREDLLGGTTNLSLEQLKREGGSSNSNGDDNPDNVDDQDDLSEIRADDDLNEPDMNEYQVDKEENSLTDEDNELNVETEKPTEP